MSAFVYLLRLKSGGLYIGACNDVNKRYIEHCKGKASRMTKLNPSVDFSYTEVCCCVICLTSVGNYQGNATKIPTFSCSFEETPA